MAFEDDEVLDAELLAPSESLDGWLVEKLRRAYDAEMRAARARFLIDMEARSCVVRLPKGPPKEFVRGMTSLAIVAAVEWVRSTRV